MSTFLLRNLRTIIIRPPCSSRPMILSSFRFISSNGNQKEHSFTVSYLVNSCGLSSESALLASERVRFETPTKPDSMLCFLRKLGLSKTQISKLVKTHPPVLMCRPEKSISPKIDFFCSKGFSTSEAARLLVDCPWLVKRSLKSHFIPRFDYLKGFLKSDEDVVFAVKHFPYLISCNLETRMAPKIDLFYDNGVPESAICRMFKLHPGIFIRMSCEKVNEIMNQTREMGIELWKPQFVEAVGTLKGMARCTWKRKVDVFKKWGLSEQEILAAFRLKPNIMSMSVDKISAAMDIFVNKLGWEPSIICKHPVILTFSLERRLLPRTLVLQFLLSKNLIQNDTKYYAVFKKTDEMFLKFVNRFDEAPEILKLFGEGTMKLKTSKRET